MIMVHCFFSLKVVQLKTTFVVYDPSLEISLDQLADSRQSMWEPSPVHLISWIDSTKFVITD